jgi:hypothetical protein
MFAVLEKEGKLPEGTFEHWNKETGKKKLPLYAHSKKAKKKK